MEDARVPIYQLGKRLCHRDAGWGKADKEEKVIDGRERRIKHTYGTLWVNKPRVDLKKVHF